MSGCDHYQELISRLLDEDLNEAETAALAEHLKECPECSMLYAAFAGVSEMVREDMVEAPERIRENVMSELRREEIRKKNSVKKKRGMRILAAAACLLLVVTAGFAGRDRMENSAAVYSADASVPAPAEAPAEAPAAAEPEMAEEQEMLQTKAAQTEAAVSEEAETEDAAAGTSEQVYASYSRYSVNSIDDSASFSYIPTWEELSAAMRGTEAEEAPEESAEERFFISFMLDGEIRELELCYVGDSCYYTDPVDGILKKLGCSFEEIAIFIT